MNNSSNLAAFYFHQGTNFRAYEYFGCHLEKKDEKYVYSFRTWAKNADAIFLLADFTDWNNGLPLTRISDMGIWEIIFTSEKKLEDSAYKFKVCSSSGAKLKGDPYAFYSRGGADGASIVCTETSFAWSDGRFLKNRRKRNVVKNGSYLPTPINIYEMHLGSFARHENNSYYTYRELAEFLPSYLKSMGYTHVEFMPVAEHPFDGSWGYQVCAFYAPTSRFGTPSDFKFLINALHKADIGVIIDWVPAHFPKDEWGLYEFDGQALYEYQGKDRQESSSWGTRFFDFGREEVQSFLISNAFYFLREFHIDGLRVDAVASMIYLDYDRAPGEWIPNVNGGRENLEAIAFLKKLNSAILGEFPDVLTIAEESDSYGGITHPVSIGGVGFSLKWNMGFANDFYDYVMTDPYFRKYKHKALNFPLMYAFSENYVMPISHDEVVHGKLSFVNKMHGSYEDKFSEMRASLMLIMTYPGKKLSFMGTEYAQFREWDYENSLEWFMLDYPKHKQMRDYVAALNFFYLSTKELYEIDFKEAGFKWILADEAERNLVAFRRRSISGREIIVVINFSGASQEIEIDVRRSYDKLSPVFTTDFFLENEDIPIIKTKNTAKAKFILPKFSGAIFRETKQKTI